MIWIILSEIALIMGAGLGFYCGIIKNNPDFLKKREKIKKTPSKKPKKHEVVRETQEEPTVNIASKIPDKEDSWTALNCDFTGKDYQDELLRNRAKEDYAYAFVTRGRKKEASPNGETKNNGKRK